MSCHQGEGREMDRDSYDVAVIGAGIIGLATAMRLAVEMPELRTVVLEKEPTIALHQTGHNSGVIHAGIYYAPGSRKANFCATGGRELRRYCDERGIPYRMCGKLVVAIDETEVPRLAELHRRGTANGAEGRKVTALQLHVQPPEGAGNRPDAPSEQIRNRVGTEGGGGKGRIKPGANRGGRAPRVGGNALEKTPGGERTRLQRALEAMAKDEPRRRHTGREARRRELVDAPRAAGDETAARTAMRTSRGRRGVGARRGRLGHRARPKARPTLRHIARQRDTRLPTGRRDNRNGAP